MVIRSRVRVALLCLLLLLATAASADNFSFTGTFSTDNDVQLFSFTIAASGPVSFKTLGYAGGTNANAQVISGGGFDPLLTLFASDGSQVGVYEDGGPGNVNLGTAGYLDSYGNQPTLPAGTYILALTESPNDPLGDLSDGFGGGGPFYTCTDNAPFCDFDSNIRTGDWAVDILTVDSAFEEGQGPVTTPEAGSLLLLASGLGSISWVKRRFPIGRS